MYSKKFFSILLSILFLLSFFSTPISCCAEDNTDALLAEGLRYFNGSVIPQDRIKGINMIVEAAEAGSVDAMLEVGYFCAYGFAPYIQENFEEGTEASLALSWFTKVADAGDRQNAAAAMIDLGYSYLLGDDDASIQEDPVAAFNFFEKAESLGIFSANDILGFFYTYGAVVDRDPDKALELFMEGARSGSSDCKYAVEQYAYAYYVGSDPMLDINYETCFKYYYALTEFDNPRAMYNVGLLYFYGLGVSPDHEQGIAWVTKAADAGFPVAQEMLESLSSGPEK